MLEGSNDSDFESGASDDEGDGGKETEASQEGGGDGDNPNVIVYVGGACVVPFLLYIDQ